MPYESHKGSAKVAGLKRRIAKEKSWLDTVSIRHDDPDAVLHYNGKPMLISQAINVEGVSFALNGEDLPMELVRVSLAVIASCSTKLNKLLRG